MSNGSLKFAVVVIVTFLTIMFVMCGVEIFR